MLPMEVHVASFLPENKVYNGVIMGLNPLFLVENYYDNKINLTFISYNDVIIIYIDMDLF